MKHLHLIRCITVVYHLYRIKTELKQADRLAVEAVDAQGYPMNITILLNFKATLIKFGALQSAACEE